MSSGVIDILVDMGFSMSKAEKALEITGNKGVEPAMEWLLAHSDEAESTPEPVVGESAPALAADAPIQDNVAGASSQSVSTTETAKSMKCDVCGKLFKSNLEVEYHATKSGHDRFSESTEEKKPLSEEEKREQLKMLEEKLRQKRKEREEQEKKNAFEREKNRIRSGKEMSEARKKLEELEMQKLLEQRKREKAEEKEARQRVRAQIEADKAARRAKAAAESSAQSVNTTSTPLPAISSSASAHHRKDYTETRLQLQFSLGLPTGKP
ncbi:UBX domain-containing protein 1-A isoform X2 [Temnothorax nylanderi]|uniref:UBX domain-containing protein 1-A isoform X2 n=1 Tax=Temnothorax nylanderi TaxID=102681 RepID=UPI003A88F401